MTEPKKRPRRRRPKPENPLPVEHPQRIVTDATKAKLPTVTWRKAGDTTGMSEAQVESERIRLIAQQPNAILADIPFRVTPPAAPCVDPPAPWHPPLPAWRAYLADSFTRTARRLLRWADSLTRTA